VSAVVTSLVWNASERPTVAAFSTEKAAPAPAPEIPEASIGDELRALQDTIASQAKQIQSLQDQIAGLTSKPERAAKARPRKSYMSQLQEEDPERHQRILERLQKTNEQTAQALADSAEFLFNLDMALMTPEQVLNHQHLLGLIEASWTQLDRMQENPQSPEAASARTKLRQNVMDMHKAFTSERQIALEQYFQWQGFTPEQALAMRTEIEEVYTKTEPANILPGTQFVGENMMIGVERMDEGDGSQSISLSVGGMLINAE
ncbi:MAG: hypothetical protein KAU94_09715, partial [Verrucomicrobia bacterium]|nr:hypothetical protein [Verrucomicrobiota bacterium]